MSAAVPHAPQDGDDLTWGQIMERFEALLLLILSSPLLLLSALAIKICCPRAPVFYHQLRVGRDRRHPGHDLSPPDGVERRTIPGAGQPFHMWKLRTMVPDAEKRTGPVWAAEKDPRITPLGRILRKTRVDELPQLLNVLRGEMSLIGPRPERPYFVDKLSHDIPEYRRRLTVAPGITGLAQVNRDYDTDEKDVRKKVLYDIFYIENSGLKMKLKILAKTIDVVVHRRGAH